MLNGGGREALAYLLQQAASHFPLSGGNLDFDQLVAVEADVQLMHDIGGKSLLADHHYRPQGMGSGGERTPPGRCKC